MKTYMLSLSIVLMVCVSLPCIGESKPKASMAYEYGKISASQCAALKTSVAAKLQALSDSDRLSTNPFTTQFRIENAVYHRHLAPLCVGHFSSSNPNYGFLHVPGIERHERGHQAVCEADRQALEAQGNVLGTRTFNDMGWIPRPNCFVESISLVKIVPAATETPAAEEAALK
jgi:hypothetical protein